jgi:hypothetical protein
VHLWLEFVKARSRCAVSRSGFHLRTGIAESPDAGPLLVFYLKPLEAGVVRQQSH